MASGTELGVGYISVVADTKGLPGQIQKAMDKAGKGATDSFKKSGKSAGQGFGQSFGSQLSASLPMSGFRQSLKQYETSAAKAGAVAGKALGTAFTAAATAGFAGLGYSLFKGFERYQALDAATHRLKNMNRTYVQLGKTGIDVQQTLDDVKSVVEGTPYSFSSAMTAATSAIAAGTTDIKQYMTDVADAAAFAGTDLSRMGLIFNQVMTKGRLQGEELMQFMEAGLPVEAWLKDIYKGVDISEALRNSQIGVEHLQYAVQKFADNTAQTAGDTIAGSIQNMQTAFAKLGAEILTALFGGPTQDATNGMKEAIDTITEKLRDMSSWVKSHRDEIKEQFDRAVDAVKTLVRAIERVMGWLDKINIGVGDVVAAFVAWKSIAGIAALTKSLTGVESMLGTQLPAAADKGAKGISAALNKVAVPAWLMYLVGQQNPFHNPEIPGSPAEAAKAAIDSGTLNTDERGNILPPAAGSPGPQGPSAMTPGLRDFLVPGAGSIAVPAPRETLHNSQGLMPASGPDPGPPPDLRPPKSDEDGGGAAKRPVVPFNPTLPEWARGGPVTPSTFSAESSWLDARHDLEEKRAYVTQLEQSGVADEQELLAARNAVAEADRDMIEQDMRLAEAKRKAYEDMYKTGEDAADKFGGMSDMLGDIVQLDSDLGISRGLVGLAENLLKFLGGLAAAPVKGLLAGIEKRLKPYTVEAQMEAMSSAGGGGMFGNMFSNLLGGGSGGMGNLVPSILKDTGSVASGPQARMAAALIEKEFGQFLRGPIGGSRDNDTAPGTHDAGLSIDIPIGPDQMQIGDMIEQYLQQNADALGLEYTIWRNQGKYPGGGGFTDSTGRHMNHIDAHFDGTTAVPMPQLPSLPFAGGGGGQGALMNLMMNAMGGGYGAGSPTARTMSGPKAAAYEAMLAAGFPPSEWAALEQLITHESGFDPAARNPSSGAFGMFQFLGHEGSKYDALGGYSPDPGMQSRAGMQYIKDRYGTPSQAWQFWQQNQAQGNAWYANGGDVPGQGSGDSVPAMLTPGEHVLTTKDVQALGGHGGVYSFRNALHRNGGGPGFPLTPQEELDLQQPAPPPPGPPPGPAPAPAPDAPPISQPAAPPPFGGGAQVAPPEPGPQSADLAPQPVTSTPPMLGPDGQPVRGPDGKIIGQDGKPIQGLASSAQDEALKRLAGFIPKAAQANTVAGTSNLSRLWMTGAEIVNGLIDQGASAASTAVSAAITGASFGAGAAGAAQAGSAASQFAIGLGAQAAKRSVSYWYQMGGIASDALVEQLFPFGAPSIIGFDSAQNSINSLIEQDKKSKRPGGVYDSGGMLEPGGVAVNMSKRPEPVLTQQQWDIMANTPPAQASHGINIENISVSDVDELSRSLSARQRLAAMQYTGRPGA